MKQVNKINTSGKITLLISVALFIASLTRTAIIYNDGEGQKSHSAISLFLMGGLSILGGGLPEWVIWLANPLYIIAITMFIKNKKKAINRSLMATSLALSFLTWHEILASESGRTATIASFEAGYWLWITSLATLTIGIIVSFDRASSEQGFANDWN